MKFSLALTSTYNLTREFPVISYYGDIICIIAIKDSVQTIKAFVKTGIGLNNIQQNVSKFTGLLYGFYQLHKEATARSFVVIVTDYNFWHVFQVKLHRDSSSLDIEGYVKYAIMDPLAQTQLQELLEFIAKICLVFDQLPIT